MKTADFIREHNACREGAEWALSVSDDMADVWDALIKEGKHGWLLWVVTRPGVVSAPTLRRLACRFIRETPVGGGKTVWDLLTDARSRKAVEVSEAYADGKATEAELDAAWAAADAVARTSADAAARAAARSAERAVCFAASSYTAARSAQIKMIAELGNPFKEEMVK